MSRLTIEIFKDGAAITDYCADGADHITMIFQGKPDGFVRLGNYSEVIKNGRCSLKLCRLTEDEYEPIITLPSRTVTLPKIERRGSDFCPGGVREDEVRRLSLNLLRLSERLYATEERLTEAEKKIYGSPIF